VTESAVGGGETAGAGSARILRADRHRRMPWRNGAGWTSEIARGPEEEPGGDPDWRISIADVDEGGPFSAFPGVDRMIVRIGPAPMVLTIDGAECDLERFSPLAFAGEAETSAALPDGPTKDLNVMTRRGRASARITVPELDPGGRAVAPSGAELVIVVLDGSVEVSAAAGPVAAVGAARLGIHDAWRQGGPVELQLDGPGRVAIVVIGPTVAGG
jgi:uncharacterized protein